MYLAYLHHEPSAKASHSLAERFHALRDYLGKLLSPDDPPLALAAAWALSWTGDVRLPPVPPEPDVILSLYRLWREAQSRDLSRFASWAFFAQPLLERDTFDPDIWGDCDAWFEQTAAEANPNAPLVLAWYRRTPLTDSQLVEQLSKSPEHPFDTLNSTAREMLATLGEPGRRVLKEWDNKEAKKAAEKSEEEQKS